jgi:1-aminocyclopropane-1-carboxylate deaminase
LSLPHPFDAPLILQPLSLDWLQRSGVKVAVLRLDLVDPELSGNKWFKLVEHLEAARRAGASGLISLGGAHSNHLHAVAAAGRRFGLATVGLLRGHQQQTPTVADLRAWGMELHWLGYGGYRERNLPTFWQPWQARYPDFYPIPEGGGGLRGALGCAALIPRLRAALESVGWSDYDAIWLAAGTGTTLAGLVIGEAGQHRVFGALAGPPSHAVSAGVATLLAQAGVVDDGYELLDASRGGFGRLDKELARFILATESDAGVPLDPIYTAKTMMALRLYVERGYVPSGTRLVLVHTGGLQGRRAAQDQLQKLIDG